MKRLTTFTTCLLAAAFFATTIHAQAVQTQSPTILNLLPAGSFDALRVQNGLISHRVAGNVGQFGTSDQWIGIGAPLSSLYGERTQWNGQAFIKALRSQNPAVPTATKDAILEWGNQGGEMQFRYIFNPTSPTGFLRILTLGSNSNAFFGSSTPIFSFAPKVGINTAKQPAITAQTIRATAGEFISSADESFSAATGVLGYVKSDGFSSQNIGVQGIVAANPDGSANYGVWGEVPGSNVVIRGSTNYGVIGICPAGFNSYAGFFQGDVFATGLYQGSDRKLKTNVTTETNALELLQQLRPVTYAYNANEHKSLNLPTEKQHGLIAQEVQAVLPELVKTSRYTIPGQKDGKASLSEEFLAVNYQGLIPLLIKAVQEQQAEINTLKAALGQQGKPVAETTETSVTTAAGRFKASQFMLSQNTPNPFSGSTVIRYSLPKGVSNATLAVFDLNGKLQLQYGNLNGSSQVTISGNTLSAGMYIYALLVEGQEVVSKRMILTK